VTRRRCVRCGAHTERHPNLVCPRFERPAPWWLRAITRILRIVP